MKKRLILLAAFLAATVLASIEIITTNSSVSERRYLGEARATYSLDGTNVVLNALILTVNVERQIGAGQFSRIAQETFTVSYDQATNWVGSYTNNQAQLVANNIKTATLADLDRIALLPARVTQYIRVPQAMEKTPPEE